MTRLAFLDPFSGASGDMLLGALLDAGLPEGRLRADLAALSLPGWQLAVRPATRGGVAATRVDVMIDPGAPARTADDLLALVAGAALPETVRDRARRVLERIVNVEARLHDVPRERVHLHELSGLDTVVDVVGTLAGFATLGVARVVVGPVETGGPADGEPRPHEPHTGLPEGHGTLPIPAPATLALAVAHDDRPGLILHGSSSGGEALTPTGAALLAELADGTGTLPAMRVDRIGYGAGGRDEGVEGRPNLLRLVLGETMDRAPDGDALATLARRLGARDERVSVVACEIDDLQPEAYDALVAALVGAGALDVSLAPIHMKKGRPGIALRALAQPATVADVAAALFEHSTTIGLRVEETRRIALERHAVELTTPYGTITAKRARTPRGWRTRPEHDAVAQRAREAGAPYREVYDEALVAATRLDQEQP